MSKRAYGMTNSEMSAIFWLMSMIFFLVVVKYCIDIPNQLGGLRMTFTVMIILLMISKFFDFISMAIPNYLISKHNLNILIDRLSNPDFIGWIRFTRNKRLQFQTVRNGSLGQTKGVMDEEKASVINDGSYTVITPCGNQAIIVNDLLSHNINMERATGWNLVSKHHGFIGFNAWDRWVMHKKKKDERKYGI